MGHTGLLGGRSLGSNRYKGLLRSDWSLGRQEVLYLRWRIQGRVNCGEDTKGEAAWISCSPV